MFSWFVFLFYLFCIFCLPNFLLLVLFLLFLLGLFWSVFNCLPSLFCSVVLSWFVLFYFDLFGFCDLFSCSIYFAFLLSEFSSACVVFCFFLICSDLCLIAWLPCFVVFVCFAFRVLLCLFVCDFLFVISCFVLFLIICFVLLALAFGFGIFFLIIDLGPPLEKERGESLLVLSCFTWLFAWAFLICFAFTRLASVVFAFWVLLCFFLFVVSWFVFDYLSCFVGSCFWFWNFSW